MQGRWRTFWLRLACKRQTELVALRGRVWPPDVEQEIATHQTATSGQAAATGPALAPCQLLPFHTDELTRGDKLARTKTKMSEE